MNMGRTLANITIALCLTALSASCAHDNAYVDIDDPGMHDIELSGTNPFTAVSYTHLTLPTTPYV